MHRAACDHRESWGEIEEYRAFQAHGEIELNRQPVSFRIICQRRNQDMSDQIAEGLIPYEVMEDGPK
jgi:hypothetical protein